MGVSWATPGEIDKRVTCFGAETDSFLSLIMIGHRDCIGLDVLAGSYCIDCSAAIVNTQVRDTY